MSMAPTRIRELPSKDLISIIGDNRRTRTQSGKEVQLGSRTSWRFSQHLSEEGKREPVPEASPTQKEPTAISLDLLRNRGSLLYCRSRHRMSRNEGWY